ncbi:hypothetical protein [Pseudosporangium ferrugineum]|uniref:Uncharacterized protein n=1 Tax=Pseudosporangium ferrugineum TaxID=439699 RepID=A0A2T0SB48_9ACTN|nr:hypothetical protein [Pseudosporangium ferrugineum]PRY30601.1 hypothetical protein CLV70_104153 [Pseudosporangium ferrugineum]
MRTFHHRGLAALTATAIAAVTLGMSSPANAATVDNVKTAEARAAAGVYTINVENRMTADVEFCLKSSSTGNHRQCSGRMHAGQGRTLATAFNPGDRLLLDFEIFGEGTHNDNVITGATSCWVSGIMSAWSAACVMG